MKTSIKDEFTLRQISPVHHTALVFTISQWQFNKSLPGILYLIYRTLVAAFVIATWSTVLNTSSFLIYFTMWGYTLCALQFFLAFVLQLSAVLLTTVFPKADILEFILRSHPIYWIVQSTAITAGFVITIIFWGFLWSNDMPFLASNFFVHGSNSIVLLFDLLVMGHPVRLLHVVYPLLFGVAYVIFNISYYYYDINRGGIGYIYIILDWGKPLEASLVVVGIFFLTVFLHLFTYIIHIIKLLIHDKLYPQSIQSTGNPTISTEQLSREVA